MAPSKPTKTRRAATALQGIAFVALAAWPASLLLITALNHIVGTVPGWGQWIITFGCVMAADSTFRTWRQRAETDERQEARR